MSNSFFRTGVIRCCAECKEREIGCHAICEKYIAENMERRKMLHQRTNANKADKVLERLTFQGRNGT